VTGVSVVWTHSCTDSLGQGYPRPTRSSRVEICCTVQHIRLILLCRCPWSCGGGPPSVNAVDMSPCASLRRGVWLWSTDVLPGTVLHLGCLLLQVVFWVFRTVSASTSLLDMCTASGGGPLGQLRPVSSLACMSSLLQQTLLGLNPWGDLPSSCNSHDGPSRRTVVPC